MISQIKKLLRERGSMSLRDLSLHFGMDSDALEPLLKLLVDKQQASVTLVGCSANGCNGCACTSLADMMVYKLEA